MPAKRNDRVAPPGPPGGWEARFATNDAAKGWEDLVAVARSNMWEAFVVLTTRPTEPENRARQHRLKGTLGSHQVHGQPLDQWQYEVTAGGRIWHCPDVDKRIVWVVAARTGHPKATDQSSAALHSRERYASAAAPEVDLTVQRRRSSAARTTTNGRAHYSSY